MPFIFNHSVVVGFRGVFVAPEMLSGLMIFNHTVVGVVWHMISPEMLSGQLMFNPFGIMDYGHQTRKDLNINNQR